VESIRLEFPGGQLSIRRHGHGAPLLYLHDAGGAGQWHPGLAAWSEAHDTIMPDHPGFGSSDRLNGVDSVEDLVYLYLDVLDRLGIDRPHLVGGSFGGWIAAELAAHSPGRFRSLTLMSAIGLRIVEHPVTDLFLLDPPELIAHLFHDRELVARILAAPPSTDAILATYRDLGSFGLYAWSPFMCNPKLEQRLHRISLPTLVIFPEHDRVVPRAHAELYARRIRGARLEVVEGVGHAMYNERPGPFISLVDGFLSDVEKL